MAGMQDRLSARGRGGYSPNRGGGRFNSSYRGGRTGNPVRTIAEYGNKRLIASNISGLAEASKTELEEFAKWKQLQKQGDTPSSSSKPSFVHVVQNNEPKNENWMQNPDERVILLLEESDKKWNDMPWSLYDRYVNIYGYTMETYKTRSFYEELLKANNCEFTHFTHKNTPEVYNFSKVIIHKIISLQDWGISPFREKPLSYRNMTVKYNYWDYVQAFDKVFLYENEGHSHTWLIKIMPEVYNFTIPSWMVKWWDFYGTMEDILPAEIRNYYEKWEDIKPQRKEDDITPDNMKFFIKFSIPWIWKFSPSVGYKQQFYCLKREAYSRFWEKMMQVDDEGQLNCAYTIDLLEATIEDYKQIKSAEKELMIKQKAKYIEGLEDKLEIEVQNISEAEIVQAYKKAMIKALAKRKEEEEKSVNSDTSMAQSNKSNNSFSMLQDAQEEDDDSDVDIDKMAEDALKMFAGK